MKLPTKVEARGRTFQVVDADGFVVCDVITGDTANAMCTAAELISEALNAAMQPAVGWRLTQKYTDGRDYAAVHETEAGAIEDARSMAGGFVEGKIEPLVPMTSMELERGRWPAAGL